MEQEDVIEGRGDNTQDRTVTFGGGTFTVPGSETDIPGILELAYGLAQAGVDLPDQLLSQFTPDQRRAFELARQGVGSYTPFLQRAGALTEQGASALASALRGSQMLGYQIPGMTGAAQLSALMGMRGIEEGAQRARASTGAAQQALLGGSAFGMGAAQQGIASLAGTGGRFTPDQIAEFMSPYEEAVIESTMADIARQGERAQQGLAAQAVGAGAFGGSRQGIERQELTRNILEQQARTAAQLRAAGFESAAQRAQGAFEEAQRRQQQAAQITGQLGQMGGTLGAQGAEAAGRLGLSAEQVAMQGAEAAGNLGMQSAQLGLSGIQAGLGAQQQAAGIGQGIAGIGQQVAGLGQLGQQLNLQDVNTMLTTGRQQQAQQQAALDLAYQNAYMRQMQPYRQLAFLSDIAQGVPSGSQSTVTQPGPSLGSQMLGIGLTVPAMYSMYQNMTS